MCNELTVEIIIRRQHYLCCIANYYSKCVCSLIHDNVDVCVPDYYIYIKYVPIILISMPLSGKKSDGQCPVC